MTARLSDDLTLAARVLTDGGVIAYPTEHCFGLGCDPRNTQAVQRILQIKQRRVEQGLILLAGSLEQVEDYADLQAAEQRQRVLDSWPGPVTWLLPPRSNVSQWLRGEHQTIALRYTAFAPARDLCLAFGGAVVSTSANRHGEAALLTAAEIMLEMGNELDLVVDLPVGGAAQASTIMDAQSAEKFR